MAVKIFIRRKVKPGKEQETHDLIHEIRNYVQQQPGYVSSQTLSALDDPNVILVVSTWKNAESWLAWERSDRRMEIELKIRELLEEPPTVRIYREE